MRVVCRKRILTRALFLFLIALVLKPGPPLLAELQSGAPPTSTNRENYVGDEACRSCHSEKAASYTETAHHLTSQRPTKESILGSFAEGENILKTSNPNLHFQLESKPDGFYQRAVSLTPPAASRSEKIDVVVGSGRKGQTYLFWKGDQLFQLPVSYWTSLATWINSPGYHDGEVNFEKRVIPDCLACHLAYAVAVGSPISSNQYIPESLVLGISCERCHGPGRPHVEAMSAKKSAPNIINPAKLPRDRQIDLCAQCHGGLRTPRRDPFSYLPGELLDKYFHPDDAGPAPTTDVHGNQVALLQLSRCYQFSSNMTCSTCHDVHQTQRDPAAISGRCLTCHRAQACGEFSKRKEKILGNCANCHMPVQASNVIISTLNGNQTKALVRSHWIRVYSTSSGASLPSSN